MYGRRYAFCSGRPYVVGPDSATGVTRIQVESVSGDTCFCTPKTERPPYRFSERFVFDYSRRPLCDILFRSTARPAMLTDAFGVLG